MSCHECDKILFGTEAAYPTYEIVTSKHNTRYCKSFHTRKLCERCSIIAIQKEKKEREYQEICEMKELRATTRKLEAEIQTMKKEHASEIEILKKEYVSKLRELNSKIQKFL